MAEYEVGTGHLAVVPSFRGFRRAVTRESTAAGREGSRGFGKAMGKGSQVAGGQAGRGFAKGFKQSATVNRALRGLNDEVKKASSKIGRARDVERTAAGRVRVAEAQLAEARKKYAADSSQVIRAEERLAGAQRKHEIAQSGLQAATGRLTAAQQALASAQSAVGKTGGFAAKLREDISPIAGHVRAAAARMGEFYRSSQLMAPVRTAVQGIGAAWTQASGVMKGLGSNVVRPLADRFVGLAKSAGNSLKSTVRDMPIVGSAVQSVSTGLSRAGTVLGNFGRAGANVASTMLGAFAPIGGRIASSLGNGLASVARVGVDAAMQIGSAFESALGLVATAAVGTLVASIKGGFGRLVSVENATAKMRGFGLATETVERVMDDVRDAVQDTMYTTGDMANIASQALVAGVKPGKQLNNLLASVKNTASGTGRELSEIGDIMSKVAASGTAHTLELNQLQKRGVPIWNLLAKEMNKSVDEVRSMATEGIELDTVVNTLNSSMGSMAKEMGETTTASIANMRSAFSRFGEALMQESFPGIKAIADLIKTVMNIAIELIGPLKEAFGFDQIGPGIEKIKTVTKSLQFFLDMLKRDGAGAQSAVAGIVDRAKELAPVIGLAAAAALPMIAGMLSKLPIIGSMFSGLGGGLLAGLAPILAAGGILAMLSMDPGQFASMIDGLVSSAVSGIGSMVESLVGLLGELVPKMVENLTANAPVLAAGFGQLLQGLAAALPQLIEGLVSAIVELIPAIVDALVASLPALIDGGIKLLLAIVDGLVSAIPQLVTAVVEAIPQVITALVSAIPQLIEGALQLFLGLIDGLVQALPQILTAVIEAIPVLIEGLVSQLPALIQGAIDLFLGIITGLANAIPQIVEAIIRAIPQFVSAIARSVPQLISGAVTLFLGLVSGLGRAIPQIIGAIGRMIPQLVSAVVRGVPQLISAGWDLLKGLARGIANAASLVMDAIGNVVTGAIDWAKGLLGIKSPSRVFMTIGKQVGQGFTNGIDGMTGAAKRSAEKIVKVTKDAFAGLKNVGADLSFGKSSFDAEIGDAAARVARVEASLRGTARVGAKRLARDVAASSVSQTNNVTMLERDPRVVFRQLNRELEVAL